MRITDNYTRLFLIAIPKATSEEENHITSRNTSM